MIAPLLVGGCILATDLDGFSRPASSPDAASPIDSGPANDAAAQGNADADAAPGVDGGVTWTDDFNRTNGGVGNGWIEGKPNIWSIEGNQLKVFGAGLDYTQHWLYRPAAEQLRDLFASVEFTPTDSPPSFPQVHVRAIVEPHRCYAVGVPLDAKKIFWVRATPGKTTTLGEVGLSEPIVVGRRHRLTIGAFGQSPVEIAAKIERESGDGVWTVIGTGSTSDISDERISGPGVFGVSANTIPNYTYDNFTVTGL